MYIFVCVALFQIISMLRAEESPSIDNIAIHKAFCSSLFRAHNSSVIDIAFLSSSILSSTETPGPISILMSSSPTSTSLSPFVKTQSTFSTETVGPEPLNGRDILRIRQQEPEAKYRLRQDIDNRQSDDLVINVPLASSISNSYLLGQRHTQYHVSTICKTYPKQLDTTPKQQP